MSHVAVWALLLSCSLAHAFLSFPRRSRGALHEMFQRSSRSLSAGCPCLRGLRRGICPEKEEGPRARKAEGASDQKEVKAMVTENNIRRPEIAVALVLGELLFFLAWFLMQEAGVI